MKIVVRFMTLEGKFALLRRESFTNYDAAKAAVEAHAAAAGYTNVKLADDLEDDTLRFTARTPGGRSGRNIAFVDEQYDVADEQHDAADEQRDAADEQRDAADKQHDEADEQHDEAETETIASLSSSSTTRPVHGDGR